MHRMPKKPLRSLYFRNIPHQYLSNTTAYFPVARSKSFFFLLLLLSTFLFLHYRPPTILISTSPLSTISTLPTTTLTPTNLSHILFSVATSASSFPHREQYLRLWYKPNTTRVLVFLDRLPSNNSTFLPSLIVSGNSNQFPYTYPRGHRSAIRIARVVKEAVERNEPGVRWFVFGDDDTLFFPENLVDVLAGYDHEQWYYIGGRSESFEQNGKISFDMAYGGAGFAISYPLARVLARVIDSCLMRYPHLYGSDSRVSACLAELGVGLTLEPGFHQVDVRGSIFGLLTSHPLSPLVSLHHLDIIDSIFPQMNKTQSLKHLVKAASADPVRILQHSVCYDRSNNLTVSVSWGYAVQVYKGNHLLLDLLPMQRTFTPWRRRGANVWNQYVFNTRDYPANPCERPAVFFLKSVVPSPERVLSTYRRNITGRCSDDGVMDDLIQIRVMTRKLEFSNERMKTRRRQCCDILLPVGKSMKIEVRSCGEEELISMYV